MTEEIILDGQRLDDRIKAKDPNYIGRTASKDEINELERTLKIKFPAWYHELYTTIPIIEAEFGVQEDKRISTIMWGDIHNIIQESTAFYPGISALKDGFIYIASCSHGSGDPIFIDVHTEEPQVYRIYHDDFSNSLLAERLVDFSYSASSHSSPKSHRKPLP